MGERRGALDGLRAIALVAVLLYHALPGAVPGGFLGVEVFFVLSGYLLTSLLLAEHRRTGRLDVRRYYARRVRRLAPALLALLAALVVLIPAVAGDDAHRFAGDLFSSLAGVTNWHLIQDHSSYFGGLGRPPLVRHLWSLSVEIQFYVVCPFLVAALAVRRQRTAFGALAAGIAGSAALLGLLYRAGDASRAYYGTDARIGALLAGALLAFVLATATEPVAPETGWARGRAVMLGGTGFVALAALAMLFTRAHEQSRLLYPLGFLATQVATAIAITFALRGGRFAATLGVRPLRWLGERSYGVYLWHWPLVALLRPRVDVSWSPPVAAAITIAAAVALGHASYVLLERPFLLPRMPKPRRMLAVQWATAAVGVAGMAALVVHLPTTDPIVSSLRTGEQVVSLQTEVPTTTTTAATAALAASAPAPAPVAAHATPAPGPPHAAPGPAPGTVAVAAIGDSVMLGSAGPLQQRFGATGFIDAKVGRQFADGVQVARTFREQGRLGQVVVVHLGTNGPPRTKDIDGLMAELAAVPHVLLVTVRMPRQWEGATNDALHGAAARYPSISLVDWHGYSNPHSEWFQSDGIHLRPAGAQAYADLIGGALPPPPPPPPPPPETTTTAPPPPPADTTTTAAPAPPPPPPATTTTTGANVPSPPG